MLKKPGAFARATPILRWPLPLVYEAYHRQLRDRRKGQAGIREYIRILMLLQDHLLPAVTAAVERTATMGVFKLRGGQEPAPWTAQALLAPHSLLPVWPNRVDHFDRLVHG